LPLQGEYGLEWTLRRFLFHLVFAVIEQVRKNNSQLPRDNPRGEGLSEVGRELREAREALGISVAEMANALRIRSVHIDSLEGGRFDELPGRPYTLGFARSMATHLGLDPDAISMRLRDEVTGAAAPVELIFPESTEDKRLSRAGWIAISLALVAVAYGAWLALSPRRDVGPPEFASMSSNANIPSAPVATDSEPAADADATDDNAPDTTVVAAPPAPAPVPTAPVSVSPPVAAKPPAPVAAKPESAPTATPPVAAAKPPAPTVAKSEPTPTSVAPAAPVSPPPAVASRPAPPPVAASAAPAPSASVATTPTSDATSEEEEDTTPEPTTLAAAPAATTPAGHVTLRARQDSWVQIQSSDGVTVMARTLRAGDSYTVPDRPGLRLTTGNAGALDVMVDGQIAPSIGQIGAVRRNVALDPARLKAGTALE
jgi:cytoskeleton protein RodZ